MDAREIVGENLFWAYSLAVYRRADVQRCCLILQDDVGIDVNLLLYAAWLASKGQRLDRYHFEQMVLAVADWQEQVVMPLRGLRRQLAPVRGAQLIREELKALELRAEQQQQDMMYACHRELVALPKDGNCLRANLSMVYRYGHSEALALPDAMESLVLALAR